MALQEIKGLKGLYDLSNADYTTWRNAQIQAGKLSPTSSWTKMDRLYRNQQFIADYGMDTFNSLDASQRDWYDRTSKVNNAIAERFGDQDNFSAIMSLGTDAKEEYYRSVYRPDEMQAANDDLKSKLPDVVFAPAVSVIGGSPYNKSKMVEDDMQQRLSNNQSTIDAIFERDRLSKFNDFDIAPYKDSLMNSLNSGQPMEGGMDASAYINQRFSSIGNAGGENSYGSNYYKAFAKTGIIKNMSDDDKAQFVAAYDVLEQKYGQSVALDAFNTKLQEYIANNQSEFRKLLNDGSAVLCGIPAYLMGDIMGYESLAIEATKGKEAAADFLSGVDADGNLLGWFNNPRYWDGVDKYATFSISEINKANRNGGVHENQNIYIPGAELDWFSSQVLHEGIKMTKFVAAEMIKAELLGAGIRGVTKPMGGRYVNGVMDMNASSGAARNFSVGARAAMVFDSGASLAHPYAIGTYDQVLQENMSAIDDQMNRSIHATIAQELETAEAQQQIRDMAQRAMDAERRRHTSTAVEGQSLPLFLNQEYYMDMAKQAYVESRINQLTDEYKSSDSYKEDISNARRAAVDAYTCDYLNETIRMSVTNGLWGQYKFDKGTKAFLNANKASKLSQYLTDTESGVALNMTGTQKVLSKIKPAGMALWDGFQSNYLDDVTVGFAKGFGTGEFNFYMSDKYNPDRQLDAGINSLGQFLAGWDYAQKGAKEAMADQQSWYDGWIGLIGSGMAVSPRFRRSERAALAPMEGSSKFSSAMQKINQYVNNPLLSGYYEASMDIADTEAMVQQFNEQLAKNKDQFADIYNVLSINNRLEASRYEDMMKAKDAKVIGAIQLSELIEKWSNDPTLSKTKVVQQYKQDMDNLVNDNISDEERQALASQFLARNPSFEAGESQEQRMNDAYEAVRENVAAVQESYAKYKSYKDELRRKDPNAHEDIIDHLAMSKTMVDNWRSRIEDMEAGTSGTSPTEGVSESRDQFFYGSYAAYQKALEEFNKAQEIYTTSINSITDKIDKLQAKKRRSREETKLLASYKLQVKHLRDVRDEHYANNSPEVMTEEDFKNVPVRDASSLLALPPRTRAQVFAHPGNYSAKQQMEIKKAVAELQRKDPNLVQAIQDIPVLMDRIAANESMELYMTDEDNAASLDMLHRGLVSSRNNGVVDALNRRIKAHIKESLSRSANDSELKDMVYTGRGISASLLEEFLNENPSRKNEATDALVKTLKLQEDAAGIINDLFDGNDSPSRTVMLGQVADLLRGSESVEQAMTTLDEAMNAATDPYNKEMLGKLMDRLETMQYIRSTKKTTPTKVTSPAPSSSSLQETTEEPTHVGSIETMQNAEDVDLGEADSPSLEEQVKETKGDVKIAAMPSNGSVEATNTLTTSSDLFAANPFFEYDANKLNERGVMEHRKGAKEGDAMNQFFSWLNENGISMQDIIDNELGNIIKANPDTPVRFLFRKPKSSEDTMQHQMILVVKNTPEVAKYHNEQNGSLMVGADEYLVIGSLWFDNNNANSKSNYFRMLNEMQRRRKQHFDANPTAEYYVDDVYSTRVNKMTGGYLVMQMPGDEVIQNRDVASLADGTVSDRNPEGLSIEDLKWGISIGDQVATIGISGRNVVYPPKHLADRQGTTYLYVKGANGVYIPTTIRPTMLNELREGSALKVRIYNALSRLASPIYQERIDARNELREVLNLDSHGKTIFVDKKADTLTLVQNGVSKTFALGEKFDRSSFLSAVEAANFRVNVTMGVLRSPSRIREYSDAGALQTNIAKLGTAGAIYDVYQCDTNGNPIIKENVSYNVGEPTRTGVDKKPVMFMGQYYRQIAGKFYEANGREVPAELATKLAYTLDIQERQLSPACEEKGAKYYVMQSGDHPVVVKVQNDGDIFVADEENSKKFLAAVDKRNANKAKEDSAKNSVPMEPQSLEDVNLSDGVPAETVLTPEQMEAMYTGNAEEVQLEDERPSTPVTPTVTPNKADINDIHSIVENNLHNSEKSSTFAQIYSSNAKARKELKSIFSEKGWQMLGTVGDVASLLRSKGVATEGITDVEAWLQMIKDCK